MTRTGSYSARVALPEALIPEEPRRELRAGVTGETLELGGATFRVGAVPLVRRDGTTCVRVGVTAAADRGTAWINGVSFEVRAGVRQLHLFGDTDVDLELAGERRSVHVELEPVRPWRVFVVHHSHLDIGYTDPQEHVLRNHLAYLDTALDYAEADDGFRWTIESNLVLERWLAARPAPQRARMLDHLHSGRFEACALPFTLHAEAASIDELARTLRFAHELRAQGVDVTTAMQTDVPGAPPGLPLVLGGAGIPYLSVAHNWAGRATPHLTGGAELPRAFRWGHVVVWHTDSPHGVAYLEGNLLGLADSLDLAETLLPEYLAALATRGWPYTGSLGVPVPRAPYPHDVLHLRVQGTIADNAAPSLVPAQIARAWNERYEWPQLHVATNREFFEALPQELPAFAGDWADWWADGLGSAARAIGFNRRAQAAVRTAQTLAALGGGTIDAGAAYDAIALFDEHTWGAAHPDGGAVDGRESGVTQWETKSALATEALGLAAALVDNAAARFRAAQRVDSVLVLNPSGFTRTDVVSVLVPDEVAVIDAATQSPVPFAVGPPEASGNRPRGRLLQFVAGDVPALGYRRFDLVAGAAAVEPAAELYRLELEDETGCVTSLVDVELGRELVDGTSSFGLGQVVHDRYASALDLTRRLPAGAPVTGADRGDGPVFVSPRSVATGGRVVERVSNAVEERTTIRLEGAGCEWLETTFRLVRGVRRLDVRHRLAKIATREKESLFVVFPFAARDPAITYELTGGVGGRARVPGSAAHMHAIRHWVSIDDGDAAIAWATLEAPLVQLGNIFLPYPPYPATLDGCGEGFVASWAMNNVWDTNFPRAQGGETRLTYAVASGARTVALETAVTLTQPLVATLGATREPPVGTVCEIDAPGIEVVLLEPTDDGFVVHLQSYANEPVEATVRGTSVAVAPGDYVRVA